MSNLPKAFRATLTEDYPLVPTRLIDRQVSSDGTRKYCFELADGARVEAVGIPSMQTNASGEPKSLTVCFSTQAGCSMQCLFCTTGSEGFTRNLSSGEMIDQVAFIQEDFGLRVSHVVSMGQGEPFLNYDATLQALDFLNSKKGFGIGARHITISTCGVISGSSNWETILTNILSPFRFILLNKSYAICSCRVAVHSPFLSLKLRSARIKQPPDVA